FKAFNIRSTEEVGSTFCNAFVGTSVPGSADVLDSLLEPESPSQFYAQFSETLFTEATAPATSQYKVYYHIYAGKDVGAQYKVYLKNPPASSYYASNPTVPVKSGYIAKGASADETVDFTAPSGYKELCVVINAKEECGFKQVTTDFGLDYVKEKFTQEQAEKEDITSEKECVSGSSSALSMANLNLQAGAEEMANPDIALRGIVRVCASNNPDVSVDSTGARWKDVGYCGDSSMRCWLDTDSVKDDLKAIASIEGVSNKILDENNELITAGSLNLEAVRAILSKSREKIKRLTSGDLKAIDDLEVVKNLNSIIGIDDDAGAGTNIDRAEALALKATVYRMGVVEAKKSEVMRVIEGDVDTGVSDGGISTDSEGIDVLSQFSSAEREIINNAQFCEDCGKGAGNVCDEAECVAIGKRIKSDCEYSRQGYSLFKSCHAVTQVEADDIQATDKEKVVQLPVPANVEELKDSDLIKRLKLYSSQVSMYSSQYRISENLIKAIIIQESSAVSVVSGKCITDNINSYGLMQVSAIAAKDVGMSVDFDNMLKDANCRPVNNIKIGTAYYSRLKNHYKASNPDEDSLKKISLAAYNWGMGNIDKNCVDKKWENCENIPDSVLQYISNIVAYAEELEKN
ncbi:MAG: transglycosylase SLT domain-containing protein, partial [Nanoarchaeota archaeon]|nr:transglycosylase SLT domain-containing protein [Nanoarchaeota archaeon]